MIRLARAGIDAYRHWSRFVGLREPRARFHNDGVLWFTGPEGFFVANGFSGHGFKTAPAVGAMVARLITGQVLPGEDPTDDLWLAPGREPIAIDTRSVLA